MNQKVEDAKIETEERSITLLSASEKIKLCNMEPFQQFFPEEYAGVMAS